MGFQGRSENFGANRFYICNATRQIQRSWQVASLIKRHFFVCYRRDNFHCNGPLCCARRNGFIEMMHPREIIGILFYGPSHARENCCLFDCRKIKGQYFYNPIALFWVKWALGPKWYMRRKLSNEKNVKRNSFYRKLLLNQVCFIQAD